MMREQTRLIKLQPNQDVTEALETVCKALGGRTLEIIAAVGSLNEAVLVDELGRQTRVTGPGLEVAGLSGTVHSAGAAASDTAPGTAPGTLPPLHATICGSDCTAAAGYLVRGENAICVTFEIVARIH